MSTTLATLNGTSLPRQFSYKLPVNPKRLNILQTYNYVVLQYSSYLVTPDTMVEWEVQSGCLSEYLVFYNLYNNAMNPSYTFNGYWNDSYTVKLITLDTPEVRSRLFTFSGSFMVTQILSYASA